MGVPDIPRLYTAIAEWAACMVYILVLKKRVKPAFTVLMSIGFLGLFCGLQIGAGELPLFMWIPGMVAAMLAIYFCVLAMADVSWLDAILWAARAFVLAEFAAAIEWQIYYFIAGQTGFDSLSMDISCLIFIYTVVFAGAFLLERRYRGSNTKRTAAGKDIFTAVGIALSIFLISNISYISKNTPFSGQQPPEIFYIRTLVNLCGIVLLFAQQEQLLWLHAKRELDAMQSMFSKQYDKYVSSKENIEMLNRRYHDLKHQIAIIRAEENPEKRNSYLENMDKVIKEYETNYFTGNKVLDILLSSKSMVCIQNDINFSCSADGKLLDFLDIMDLCSIVGNALDNAIENAKTMADKQKRIIRAAVFSKSGYVIIKFENYFENNLSFEDGLPLTTKKDINNHGYGLKSIKAVAEKYGGNINISVEDNWFNLSLILPMPHKD